MYLAMPGTAYIDGKWADTTHYDYWINDRVRPMTGFADVERRDPEHSGYGYDAAYDAYGP